MQSDTSHSFLNNSLPSISTVTSNIPLEYTIPTVGLRVLAQLSLLSPP